MNRFFSPLPAVLALVLSAGLSGQILRYETCPLMAQRLFFKCKNKRPYRSMECVESVKCAQEVPERCLEKMAILIFR